MTSTKTAMDHLEKWMACQKRGEKAKKRLLEVPVQDLGGHVFKGPPIDSPHPFNTKGDRLSFLSDDASKLVDRIAAIRGDETVSIGLGEALREIVAPCIRCGLHDWIVDKNGLKPFGPCPFPDGVRQTTVVIPVPSGILAVGVTMHGFCPIDGSEIDGIDLTNFRAHHMAKLGECSGFAEVETYDQSEHYVHRADNGSLVLTNVGSSKRRKPLANIFPFMPQFACSDWLLFAPLYEMRREEIRADAVYDEINVEPGNYSVTVTYGKHAPKVEVLGRQAVARVIITRVGPTTSTRGEGRAKAYLDAHPWLRAEYMERHMKDHSDDSAEMDADIHL